MIAPDGESKRRVLGEEIALDCESDKVSINVREGVCLICNWFSYSYFERGWWNDKTFSVLTSSLPFTKALMMEPSIVRRFGSICLPDVSRWSYYSLTACINFAVNKPIMLHGVQHSGSHDGNYTTSTEIKNTTDNRIIRFKRERDAFLLRL